MSRKTTYDLSPGYNPFPCQAPPPASLAPSSPPEAFPPSSASQHWASLNALGPSARVTHTWMLNITCAGVGMWGMAVRVRPGKPLRWQDTSQIMQNCSSFFCQFLIYACVSMHSCRAVPPRCAADSASPGTTGLCLLSRTDWNLQAGGSPGQPEDGPDEVRPVRGPSG